MRRQRKKLARAARLWASGQLHIPQGPDDDPDAEFDEAAAALGLQPQSQGEGAPDARFCLWPDNLSTWALWHRLQTQWRVGMAGRTGLDYTGVLAYLRDVARIKGRDLPGTFARLQAMERAALDAWDKK